MFMAFVVHYSFMIYVMSSKAGILQEPNLGGEVTSNVTSSSGPVKFTDLQRILSNIEPADRAVDPDEGVSLEDILKPELIVPLIETLPLEQGLGSYLPEGRWSPEDILELLQSPPFRQQMDSFAYALEDSVAKTSEYEELRQDNTDLRSESCNRKGPMDESK
ncbi:hypothetical protein ACFX13_013169 [Malus domestica]|uniref:RPN13 DEUBAD domain-containing protein n=1 Tax=Malus domestica TaxID=3750 RepID=A0A498I8H3_MALDO|nr:hypothetical protein DVH24_002020 [Malus domestica]